MTIFKYRTNKLKKRMSKDDNYMSYYEKSLLKKFYSGIPLNATSAKRIPELLERMRNEKQTEITIKNI